MKKWVFVLIGVLIVLGVSGCLNYPSGKQDIIIYPQEFVIYQDYVKTIGGKPRVSDIGVVEATVMLIRKNEICPDKTNATTPESTKCSVEPYPKDSGIVRIDKIINYTPYSYSEEVTEQLNEGKSLEEGETTPGYEGPNYTSTPKPPEYEPLQEGQEVQTIFLLTVRPTKIRYTPFNESKAGWESAQLESDQQTASHQLEPGRKTFKPIPKDGDYFVFTTKIGDFPETVEKILPGLKVGSKFRAEVYYDGLLYVKEYVVREW